MAEPLVQREELFPHRLSKLWCLPGEDLQNWCMVSARLDESVIL